MRSEPEHIDWMQCKQSCKYAATTLFSITLEYSAYKVCNMIRKGVAFRERFNEMQYLDFSASHLNITQKEHF
jgi:hypothetical protein